MTGFLSGHQSNSQTPPPELQCFVACPYLIALGHCLSFARNQMLALLAISQCDQFRGSLFNFENMWCLQVSGHPCQGETSPDVRPTQTFWALRAPNLRKDQDRASQILLAIEAQNSETVQQGSRRFVSTCPLIVSGLFRLLSDSL